MSTPHWHRSLVTAVILFIVIAAALYAISIFLAPADGRGTAGLFDGYAVLALLVAIGIGIVDFFVRPLGGRSGDAQILAEAARARGEREEESSQLSH